VAAGVFKNSLELPDYILVLLDQDDSRQLLHITYGFLLNAKTPDGENLFRERLYRILTKYEEDYWSLLERHFEKHLSFFGGGSALSAPTDHLIKVLDKTKLEEFTYLATWVYRDDHPGKSTFYVVPVSLYENNTLQFLIYAKGDVSMQSRR
jgi:hypothetical protein